MCGRRGFTLIELMVTVVIMGLLVGGGVAAYSGFNERQQVVTKGKEVMQFIRTAQKKASSGEKPSGCSDKLTAYKVEVVLPSEIQLLALCSGGSSPETLSIDPLTFGANTDFSFLTVGGGTSLSADEIIEVKNGSTTYQITISHAGSISGSVL